MKPIVQGWDTNMEEQILIDQFITLQGHLRRVAFVPRCAGTMQLLPNYTDAVHAYNCAMIYLDLCTVKNLHPANEVLIALLTHDNLEAFTGDLLAPVKDAINDRWDEVERQVQNCAADLANLPDGSYEMFCKLFPRDEQMCVTLNPAQLLLVKSIDMYEYLVRMMEEHNSGNKTKQVWRGLRYGTKTLNARLSKLMNFKEEYRFYDAIILGKFMHVAYQALLTEYKLWEVVV
jgi:5'-deoxynucleotidase YfbR-like HD superfamily hydrolase